MFSEITCCRICGNSNLLPVLDLGIQKSAGIFPKTRNESVEELPLELIKCHSGLTSNVCGLVQLRHSAAPSDLFTTGYGYRSGLNKSMVHHLRNVVRELLAEILLNKGDLIIDIGSNDCTLLDSYPIFQPNASYCLAGFDPVGDKFKPFYNDSIRFFPHFFNSSHVRDAYGTKKAKIITSISMFYDLEDPLQFMYEIAACLHDQGIWLLEQSYLPTMLKMNSYDTICSEHLEYYSLKQIIWMADRVGLVIRKISFNDINGGSISIVLQKKTSGNKSHCLQATDVTKNETKLDLDSPRPYYEFRNRVNQNRDRLRQLIGNLRDQGKIIYGYGASTKGNVLLQYCGLDDNNISFIVEVSKEKIGSYTPGSYIPIISEADAKENPPDYYLVLPWHYKDMILQRESHYIDAGGKFIFPMPEPFIV